MKALAIIICFIFTSGCLKAKKSPFDISSPSGLFGSFLISALNLNSQQGIGTGTSTGTGTGSTTTSFSVSGSISGFTAGSLILQNNAANDLTLTATNTYSFTGLASGSTYAITIKTNPTGFVCSIVNASGTITANVTNANITCAVMTVNPAYTTNGLKWNDYINRDFSKDIFSQADTACNTANTGGYRTCVHAGEIRKFDIPSRSTCTGLTATDNLSALNWICKTNSTTGGVSFYSSGLKKGKYLSDLIDWTNNVWQSLTITVKDGTTTHAVSNALKLWTNVIDVTETVTPSTAGTIYLYKSNTITTNGISQGAAADKTSLLFKSSAAGSIINFVGGACPGAVGLNLSKNFTWIEGSMNFTGTVQFGISMSGANFTVFKNVKMQNAGVGCTPGAANGIKINSGGINNYFEDIVVANTLNGSGININSNYNFFYNILVGNSVNEGIVINTASLTGTTILSAITMNNGGGGVRATVQPQNDFLFSNMMSVNNGLTGIDFNNVQNFNFIFKNLAMINNNSDGFRATNVAGNSLTLENFAGISNSGAGAKGINLDTGSSLKLRGVFKIGGNTIAPGCAIAGFASSNCTNTGMSTPDPLSITDDATLPTLLKFNGTPTVSPILTDNGLSTGIGYSPTDWVSFANLFRGVGYFTASSFPSTSHQGKCSGGGTCTIWDFSLKTTDTVLRNANITGGGTGCPTAATMFPHTFTTGSVTILRNSVELINDGVGNDNGLCEANEDCLLTPNIGAYQGHGNLVSSSTLSGGCADVTSQGIKLYQYDTNGY
jgi:hypothetical protein